MRKVYVMEFPNEKSVYHKKTKRYPVNNGS